MFRETLFFKTALYSAYDWLAKIRQLIFCRVPSALQLLSVSAFQNRSRGKSCVVERGASGKNPFRHFALRNATSPEGGGLGKEGRSRPYSSTTGRSLPLSCKLFASAKASPFRERWHGEAVTERVCSQDEPSQSRCARQLVPLFVSCRESFSGRTPSVISLCEMPPPPKVEALAKRAGLVLIRQQQGEACR